MKRGYGNVNFLKDVSIDGQGRQGGMTKTKRKKEKRRRICETKIQG